MDPLNLLPNKPVDPEGFNAFITKSVDGWYDSSQTFSTDQRKIFRKKLYAMASKICEDISRMSSLNYSPAQKAFEARRLLTVLNGSAWDFYEECEAYDRMKLNENRELIETRRKIEEAMIDFTPFAPSQCPLPLSTSDRSAAPSTQSHNDNSSHFSITETVNRKIAHDLHHAGKKGSALTYEFGSHLLFHESENSNNPYRDRIISALSHLAIDKAIPALLPKCLPGYLAISGSHLIAEGSRKIESHLEIVAKDREIALTWDIQYQNTGEGPDFKTMIMINRMTLQAIQVPSAVVNKATASVKKSLVGICDGVGLTEDNIANITKDVMEKVVNDPETLFVSDPFLDPL